MQQGRCIKAQALTRCTDNLSPQGGVAFYNPAYLRSRLIDRMSQTPLDGALLCAVHFPPPSQVPPCTAVIPPPPPPHSESLSCTYGEDVAD